MAMINIKTEVTVYCTCGELLEQVRMGYEEMDYITVKPCRRCLKEAELTALSWNKFSEKHES